MVRKTKKKQEEFEDEVDGVQQEFDENANIRPDKLLKAGLNTMHNEIKRLVQRSKDTGLNGMQAHALKEYVKVASEVVKKHPGLGIGIDQDVDIDKLSEEELAMLMIEAGRALTIDLTEANIVRGRPARQKVIDHDAN